MLYKSREGEGAAIVLKEFPCPSSTIGEQYMSYLSYLLPITNVVEGDEAARRTVKPRDPINQGPPAKSDFDAAPGAWFTGNDRHRPWPRAGLGTSRGARRRRRQSCFSMHASKPPGVAGAPPNRAQGGCAPAVIGHHAPAGLR
jgi:hypothetical protein